MSDGDRGRKRPAVGSPRSPTSGSDSYRSSSAEDDNRGHITFRLGENLTPEYKIISVLGKGTFGEVLECWDRRKYCFVAIKVIRDITKYRDAARIEIKVLEELRRADTSGRQPIIQLDRWFDLRGHVCMVFERLGLSVFDFLRRNDYHAFSLAHVIHIGRQLLQAVAFMHKQRIIHTDLKPENILFVRSDYTTDNGVRRVTSPDVRLIDLGSATFEESHHTSIVSTRHYRAPEVILGLGWSYPADLWSVACILIELYTGEALFQTHDDVEHLAMMERVLGPLPNEMRTRATGNARRYFDRTTHDLLWPKMAQKPESTARYVNAMRPLGDVVYKHPQLLDLLRQLLQFTPESRMSAARCLEHPLFGGPAVPAVAPSSSSLSSSSSRSSSSASLVASVTSATAPASSSSASTPSSASSVSASSASSFTSVPSAASSQSVSSASASNSISTPSFSSSQHSALASLSAPRHPPAHYSSSSSSDGRRSPGR